MPEPGAGPGPNAAMLDEPPPQPPGTPKKADRASLVQNQMKQQQESGMGADTSDTQVMIVQTTGEVVARLQRLGGLLPQLAPAFNQISQSLQQAVPQAMADQLAGMDQTGAGIPPPGGPMPPPPSAPPMMGGGPPSMAGAPVQSPTPAGVVM